jgi:lysozyme
MDLLKIKESIKKHEGLKLKPYLCPNKKLTIGYGRNLQDNGITVLEAEKLLETDLLNLKLELEDSINFFHKLDHIRQNVLIEMAYNMGVPKLLNFKNTLEYMRKGDFINASTEMLDSAWHRDFIQYDLKDGKRNNNGLLRSEFLSMVMKEGVYEWNF